MERFALQMELLQEQRERENKEFWKKKAEKERRKQQRRLRRKAAMGSGKKDDIVGTVDVKFEASSRCGSGSWKTELKAGAFRSQIPDGTPSSTIAWATCSKPPLLPKSPLLGASASTVSPTMTPSMAAPARFSGTLPTGAAGASSSKRGKSQPHHGVRTPSLKGGSSKSIPSSADLTGSWSSLVDVPDFEVNSLAAPTGEF
jgi:hypothetical protein